MRAACAGPAGPARGASPGRLLLALAVALLAGGQAIAPATAQTEARPAAPASPSAPAASRPPEPARIVNVAILDDTRPLSYTSRFGYRVGFEFELGRTLCAELPIQCSFVPMRPDEVVSALTSRRVDVAIARLSITPTLDEILDFTAAYFHPSARYVVPADLEDAGRKIEAGEIVLAAVEGTPNAAYLQRRGGDVRIYGDAESMWLDLALGRIGAALTNVTTAREEFLSTPVGEDFRFARSFVRDPEVYGVGVGIAVREGAGELLAMFAGALERFRRTEEFAALRDRYLDRDMESAPD